MPRPVVALVGMGAPAAAGLADYLERRGYEVRRAAEEWSADSLLSQPGVDVAVLGETLGPGVAFDLLRRHGGEAAPGFVVLAARADLIDRVLALELGAADVVPLPFVERELAARIAGIVARRGMGARELAVFENATVDLRAALVMHRSGAEDQLSAGQVALLRLFLANPRRVLSREDIMAAAPAESTEAFDRSIDSRIVRLRRKLDTDSIVTIRGAGYRFDPPVSTGC